MPLRSRTTISLQCRSAASLAADKANVLAFEFFFFVKFHVLILNKNGATDSATPIDYFNYASMSILELRLRAIGRQGGAIR